MTGVALVPSSPAFAAVCRARVTWESISETVFNHTSTYQCARVQARMRVWWDSSYSSTIDGPIESYSSYLSVGGGQSYDRYGRAKPATTWSTKRWTSGDKNEYRDFTG